MKADSLAGRFIQKDTVGFWNDIKKFNMSDTKTIASNIDGVSGEYNITNLWKTHYSQLLNCNNNANEEGYVKKYIENNNGESVISINVNEVREAIGKLKTGKSAGVDGLQSEQFKANSDKLSVYLTLLFNVILSHAHVPSNLMITNIVPILKDKKGLITDKNNYRPIAVTTVISKILELVILKRLQAKLITADNQFGFKSGHSTDMCVYMLKHVIEYYNNHGSPVYVCYLDASKAFDRINHWKLFRKLINRKIDCTTLRLIIYWYCNQSVCVKWGNCLSSSFTVTNGVRQGGILSPMLFNIYMDGLSTALNESRVGCHINGKTINHLMYADDTCILAPCPSALRKLLNICTVYAASNDILFNETKTKCMCFKPKCFRNLCIPKISFKGEDLDFVDHHKYLGIIISDDLTDLRDIKRYTKGLYGRGNMLVQLFKNCSDVVKNFLFRTYCSSIYGCMLWCSFNAADIKKARVAYNDIYRSLHGIKRGESISQIYVYNNIDSFNVLMRKYVYAFRERLLKSCNSMIYACVNNMFFINSPLSLKWRELLYIS